MNRSAGICAILLACLLLAVGRLCIRMARREPRRPKRVRGKAIGWALMLAGLMAMIFGVVIW